MKEKSSYEKTLDQLQSSGYRKVLRGENNHTPAERAAMAILSADEASHRSAGQSPSEVARLNQVEAQYLAAAANLTDYLVPSELQPCLNEAITARVIRLRQTSHAFANRH